MRFRITALVTGLLAVVGMVLSVGVNTAPALAQSLGIKYAIQFPQGHTLGN